MASESSQLPRKGSPEIRREHKWRKVKNAGDAQIVMQCTACGARDYRHLIVPTQVPKEIKQMLEAPCPGAEGE